MGTAVGWQVLTRLKLCWDLIGGQIGTRRLSGESGHLDLLGDASRLPHDSRVYDGGRR